MATYRPSFGYGSTPVLFTMLAIFAVIFLLAFTGLLPAFVIALTWVPNDSWILSGRLWQPFTFPFVHIGFIQVLFDGIVLYFFGGSLERAWGGGRFAFFFFASGLVAGLIMMALSPWIGVPVMTGMVGSFVAVVVAFAALNPYATVYLYFFPVQARWLAALVIAWEFFGDFGRYGGIPSAAAVVGGVSLFAWAFTVFRPRLPSVDLHGSSFRERFDRWQQRRRMRAWQRKVGRIDKPEDLFKR
jgi:membrane associated rhomboid family serine protease